MFIREREAVPDQSVLPAEQRFVNDVLGLFRRGPTKNPDFDDVNTHFRTYLSQQVPFLFPAPTPPLQSIYDEKTIITKLFDPLLQLLADDPTVTSFEDLRKSLGLSDRTSHGLICGHTFDSGEPTYTCRECATDPTCVMCYDCFSNSAHRLHKYKMCTSAGTGYCDCGDAEAWKQNYSCSKHDDGAAATVNVQDDAPLQPHTLRRCALILEVMLKYCIELLCWEYAEIVPSGLQQVEGLPLQYQTMLMNDESHTYDQVIQALKKAINCSEEQAMQLAAMVDKDGRSSVRSGTKEQCEATKEVIEERTSREGRSALLVNVMDTSLVAYQIYGQRLLAFIPRVLQEFRPALPIMCHLLFNERVIPPPVPQKLSVTQQPVVTQRQPTLLAHIMTKDVKLWKSARTAFHQLIISSIMMNMDYKRQFSKLFTQMYRDLMQDYIEDDHDHSLSIVSLSVQTFTVPSIARLVIADENALQLVIESLLVNFEKHKDRTGVLHFERSHVPTNFKRAQNVLFDLKYLLTSPPAPHDWTENLRRNFVEGFKFLLELLTYVQGMNSMKRQIGNHQEFEPEWETAFNIQLKLSCSLSNFIDWAASDREVLIAVFKATLSLVRDKQAATRTEMVKIANRPGVCVVFDVASLPVCIHLPIIRLLAGLFLRLGEQGLNYNSPELTIDAKPTAERLIELSLRALVFCGQVQAGMWRRNGFAVLNQVHNYYAPNCRVEMFDRDVVMMQIGAALIEPNEFVIMLLHKFGLQEWAQVDFNQKNSTDRDVSLSSMSTLIEELLHLLIMVLCERYVPGIADVTENDCLRYAAIQVLSKGESTYSKIEKHFVALDACERSGLEHTVREIATFKQSGATGPGVFELKEQYAKHFNRYYYHFSKQDASKADVYQQQRHQTLKQDPVCPPPPLPPFSAMFSGISRILRCDVALHLFTTVLERALVRARTYSDGQLHRVLFLLGVALNEDQQECTDNLTTRTATESRFLSRIQSFLSPAKSVTIPQLLQQLSSAEISRMEPPTLCLLRHITQRLNQLISPEQGSEVAGAERQANEVSAEQEAAKRREKAQERRAKAMEMMQKLQKNFIKENSALFDATSGQEDMDTDSKAVEQQTVEFPIAVGSSRTQLDYASISSRSIRCILCQETQDVTFDGRATVIAALVQNSTLFAKTDKRTIDDPETHDPLFMPVNMFLAPHTSSCGHVMHADCWQKFYEAIVEKEQRRGRLPFRQPSVYDIERNEYLCPLCKRISNTVLPVLPPVSALKRSIPVPPAESSSNTVIALEQDEQLSYDAFIQRLADMVGPRRGKDGRRKRKSNDDEMAEDQESSDSLDSTADEDDDAMDVTSTEPGMSLAIGSIVASIGSAPMRTLRSVKDNVRRLLKEDEAGTSAVELLMDVAGLSPSNIEMMKVFAQSVYMNALRLNPNAGERRIPLTSWLTTAYTVRSVAALLEYDQKPCFGAFSSRENDVLHSIVRFATLGNLTADAPSIRKSVQKVLHVFLYGEYGNWSILSLDMLTCLVQLCLAYPWLYDLENDASWHLANGSTLEHHFLKLVLTGYMAQVLLKPQINDETSSTPVEGAEKLVELQAQLLRTVKSQDQPGTSEQPTPSPHLLANACIAALKPFLHSCALFFHALTMVPPPEALKDPSIDSFQPLLRYLDLPTTLPSLLAALDLPRLQSWLTTPLAPDAVTALPRQPVAANPLVRLPDDFAELVHRAAQFKCVDVRSHGAQDDVRVATMCLVCGQMMCSGGYCCDRVLNGEKVGTATYHCHMCSAGNGMILRVRDCQVLLMSERNKGHVTTAPYIDEFGETDLGFRRGNPMHLSRELYAKLERIWMTHCIHEEVASQLEYQTGLVMQTEWQTL